MSASRIDESAINLGLMLAGPKYHTNVVQGSEEWHALRCGLLTASEMKLIITPTFKAAANDKERSHLYELAAQRITRYVEPAYISDDMLRGWDDEIHAKQVYVDRYAPIEETGFITNDKFGFTIGYSPDGLVGNDGLIEIKSRRQKYQTETIIAGEMPKDYLIQVQTGLLVSERQWCDFISFCGGMPMFVCRVFPDDVVQAAIVSAASAFEARLQNAIATYRDTVRANKMPMTRRVVREEMRI